MKKRTMFLAAVCVALATLCGCTRTEDLPSVSTSEVTEVTTTTATAGGTILANGASVTVRGVCYSSTNPNPTIDDLHTTDGSGTGDFVSRLEGLQASTTYHVKAYAMNNSGVAYGETVTFTTKGEGANLPQVTTHEIVEYTSSSAWASGTVIDNGTVVSARGFCYSATSTEPTVNDSHTTDGSGSGNFESTITGLQKSTTYHVRAYAQNENGVAYGETVTFTTYEKDEDYYANLLSRHPNGWKLSSATSAPDYIMPDGSHVADLINGGYLQDFEAAYILVFKDDYTHYVKPGAVVAPNPNMGYTTLTNLGSYHFYDAYNSVCIDMKVPYIHNTATITSPIKIISLTDSEFIIKVTVESDNNPYKLINAFTLKFVPA